VIYYYSGSKFQGSKFKPARPDYIGTGGSWTGVRERKYSRIIDLKYLLRFEDKWGDHAILSTSHAILHGCQPWTL